MFDSSTLPGEILDLTVAKSAVLERLTQSLARLWPERGMRPLLSYKRLSARTRWLPWPR